MSSGVAPALEKRIQDAKDELVEDLTSLRAELPEESVNKFEETEEEIKLEFHRDIEYPVNRATEETNNHIKPENGSSHLLSSINSLGLSFEQNKQAEAKVKELRGELEPLYRLVQLFHPESKENFITSIWWFSQQGKAKVLDALLQVRTKPPFKSEEIMLLLEQAQKEICKRECKDLITFYSLKSDELLQAIEKMIQNEREEPFAPLPELFAPPSVEKAITQLEETKRMIQRVYQTDELNNWLSTPNRNFLNETPKEVILKGKAFRILQHFIRLGEGIS